ncbi:MAG: right-handed parallel beta-helix repeat-containing protein, partial [Pirellulaceae bacterium]|nr:right-handed parallel beta-helix repeat-containing protein [Pirellulaceae bacterium]
MAGLRRAPHRRLLRSLRRRQLFLESLEDRRLLSVFTVNSTDDEPDWFPGDGQALTAKKTTTLRAAIMEANARAGKDTIEFNISGAGPHVIKLATRLPAIIDPISIDGYTQPGARPNSQTLRDGHDAVVKIELDGSRLPIGTNGLDIVGGQSEVMGLAIHSFYGRPIAHQEYLGTTIVGEGGMGIWLWGGSGSQIVGNFLGATAAGQLPTYPRPADAISTGVVAGSADNVIQENLVVGHSGAGIALGAKIATELAENVRGNRVVGNYVGLLQDGQTPRGNSTGVLICWGAFGNYIGGDEARLGNLISGNTGVGISIVGVAPENKYVGGNVIQRNLIGTDRTGTSIDRDGQASSGDETGNRYAGIQIDRSPGNVVGGAFVSAGNVISGNLAGVTIFEPPSSGNQISHNKVGTDLTGSIALPNTLNGIQIQRSSQNEISGNVIAGNLGTGVYVEGPAASGNRIQDNLIGVDSTGSTGLGNGNGGIDILHASANTIQRNTISGSPNYGIGVTILGVTATQNVVTKNRIGTDAAGLRAVGNTGMGVAIVDASENTLSDNVISGNEMDGVLIRGV